MIHIAIHPDGHEYRHLFRVLNQNAIHFSPTEGIPTDGMPVSKIVTVSVPITVIFTIAGVCGIVFAASFGMFNFVFREKR